MVRGTFANKHNRNKLSPDALMPETVIDGQRMSFYQASGYAKTHGYDYVVIAGRGYGAGSSRDWAAKGTALLGVKVVVAISFERIHRSNLIGMGVLPCRFEREEDYASLVLRGDEEVSIAFLGDMVVHKPLELIIKRPDGTGIKYPLIAAIDSAYEGEIYRQGGVLLSILRKML
jgi:aconitate hydratase